MDIGAFRDPAYADKSRDAFAQDDNVHLAKLFIMNAKHYLRETPSRLKIDILYDRYFDDGSSVGTAEKFASIYRLIDFSTLPGEIVTGAANILAEIAAKN